MLYDDRKREEVCQLEDDFFDWFEAADADEFEDGTLDGFLEELEQADPLPGGFDPQKSLEDFHQKYAAFLEPQKEEKRKSRLSRRAFFAVAAVAAVLISMATAQALGVDILGIFSTWTDEHFTFTRSAEEAGYQKRFYPMEEGERKEYSSLDEALTDFQIDLPIVPRWFPEQFKEFEITGSVRPWPYGMRIFALSRAEVEGHTEGLTVDYSEFGEHGPTFVIEKDKNDPIFYERNGMLHYIVTDNDYCTAAWTIDNIQCIISASITVEEMKQIIDSIYLDEETEAVAPLPEKEQEMHLDSIAEALGAAQFDPPLAPKWLPERFDELEVTVTVFPARTTVFAFAKADQGDILQISYDYNKDAEGQTRSIIEEDDNPLVLYESGGNQHYLMIMTNNNWRYADWMQGDIECTINGNITEDEIKRIIDSIYS